MIANPAQTERHHLANQAAPVFSLVRKRCACGKASTARQLGQYGRCVTCVRQPVSTAMDPYKEFCRLRDHRKAGAEVSQYTEGEAFALAINGYVDLKYTALAARHESVIDDAQVHQPVKALPNAHTTIAANKVAGSKN